MDLRDGPEEAAFRATLRTWLEANVPSGLRGFRGWSDPAALALGREWSRRLAQAGYAGLTWPKEYGGAGQPWRYQAVYLEELARAVLQAAGAREAGRLPYSPRPARCGLWLAKHLPDWVLWGPLNRRIARAWRLAFEGQPPIPPPRLEPDLLEQLSADRWYDTQRLRDLGFAPRFPSAVDGLQQLALQSRTRGLLPTPQPILAP